MDQLYVIMIWYLTYTVYEVISGGCLNIKLVGMTHFVRMAGRSQIHICFSYFKTMAILLARGLTHQPCIKKPKTQQTGPFDRASAFGSESFGLNS